MTEAFETSGNSEHDVRIIPIKEYNSVDGSCERLALYISFSDSWSGQPEFLKNLNLNYPAKTPHSQNSKHFDKLLQWFNNYTPSEILIVPRHTSVKQVIHDEWDCKAIMWEEDGRYYVFFWDTSA